MKDQSPSVRKVADQLAQSAFGRTFTEAEKAHVCVGCGQAPGGFRDDISRREFAITNLCQKCQDKLYGE